MSAADIYTNAATWHRSHMRALAWAGLANYAHAYNDHPCAYADPVQEDEEEEEGEDDLGDEEDDEEDEDEDED